MTATTANATTNTNVARMTRRPLPRARTVAGATVALFLAVFAFLIAQLRNGRDPALGSRRPALVTVAAHQPRSLLIRKTIITRVVIHEPADGGDDAAARVDARVPVTVPVAPPTVARAPAVAPAPDPLTTHSS